MKSKYGKILLKAFLFFQLLFVGTSVSAKEVTLDELAEKLKLTNPDVSYLYIIGEHVFTSEHLLTTQDTMLAARTIKFAGNFDQTVKQNVYNEMSIIYVEATYDDDWNLNGFKYVSNIVGTTPKKDIYDINYIDYDEFTKEVIVSELVEEAYGTMNDMIETNDKFEMEVTGNNATVTILDTSMTSVMALAGTGVATAAENLLETAGVASVTLSGPAGEPVTVSKDDIMSKLEDLDELFKAIAGGENASGLSGKTVTIKINVESGYDVTGDTTFSVTFG